MRKKILSIALALCMIICMMPSVAMAAETSVAINSIKFPDANFRNYVKTNFDTDNNDYLSSTEIASATEITISKAVSSENDVGNLQGVEYLTSLTRLKIGSNTLSDIDVSKNTELTYLSIDAPKLEALDVTNNIKLETLICSSILAVGLTELDVSKNTALTQLDCSRNELTTLDVSNNTALQILKCSANNLTSLDVSNNPALTTLECYTNDLTTLDVSSNSALKKLMCGSNRLESIYLPTSLSYLSCENNNLPYLDLTGIKQISGSLKPQNAYKMPCSTTGTYDLSKISSNFDATKISNLSTGSVSDGILTVDPSTTEVTYSYDCGNGSTMSGFKISFCKAASITGTTATAKAGKTINVDINLTENTGLTELQLDMVYDDSILEFVSAENGDIFVDDTPDDGDDVFICPDPASEESKDSKSLQWSKSDTKDVTTTGRLATLTFKIKEGVSAGQATIAFTCDSSTQAFDTYGDSVTVTTSPAMVTIIDFIYGDVNKDDKVDINDVITLRRSLAHWIGYTIDENASDVDNDGKVTLRDVTILRRHIADWNGYGLLPVTDAILPVS